MTLCVPRAASCGPWRCPLVAAPGATPGAPFGLAAALVKRRKGPKARTEPPSASHAAAAPCCTRVAGIRSARDAGGATMTGSGTAHGALAHGMRWRRRCCTPAGYGTTWCGAVNGHVPMRRGAVGRSVEPIAGCAHRNGWHRPHAGSPASAVGRADVDARVAARSRRILRTQPVEAITLIHLIRGYVPRRRIACREEVCSALQALLCCGGVGLQGNSHRCRCRSHCDARIGLDQRGGGAPLCVIPTTVDVASSG